MQLCLLPVYARAPVAIGFPLLVLTLALVEKISPISLLRIFSHGSRTKGLLNTLKKREGQGRCFWMSLPIYRDKLFSYIMYTVITLCSR